MRRRYVVDMQCPQCGELHRVTNEFFLDGGPTEAGTVAELYAGRELPPPLVSKLVEKPDRDRPTVHREKAS
jgi:hypothetical protein